MQEQTSVNDRMKAAVKDYWAQLMQVLQQLAQTAGSRPPKAEEISAFFHDFMNGYWNAFEEAATHDTGRLKRADRQMLELQEQIAGQLGPDHRALLSLYEALLSGRLTMELDQTFLVGYQTAIRFLFMGVLPLPDFYHGDTRESFEERSDDNSET